MEEDRFDRVRRHYPLLQTYAYFETAATGAIPDYVYEGFRHYQDKRYLHGGNSIWDGVSTFEMFEQARKPVAKMLGASPESIAFGENTSLMFAQLSAGLALEPGDNVILTDTTFWSMAFAWDMQRQIRGVEIRFVPSQEGKIPPEAIFDMVDERTRVISLNHVESNTGFKHDLATIGKFCREKDILLAVDTAQSAGVMQIDVERMGIDFLAGNNYKWMQGYCGVGYGYFGPRVLERIRPTMAGWRSHSSELRLGGYKLDLRNDAGRFEFGYPNAPGLFAMSRVAEAYLELGASEIENYVLSLGEQLRKGLDERPGLGIYGGYAPQNRSQILIITSDQRYAFSSAKLLEHGVVLAVRDGAPYGAHSALRVGFHYYNSAADIERLLGALDACRIG